MFWIGFTDEPLIKLEPHEDEGKVGLLVLGQDRERFVVHTRIWSELEYLDHWRAALIRALDGKEAALITDMRTPTESSHLIWWPMWRVNNEVVIHNQLLSFEEHKIQETHIDVGRLHRFIGEYHSHDKEGTPLSEWTVSVSEVEVFLGV